MPVAGENFPDYAPETRTRKPRKIFRIISPPPRSFAQGTGGMKTLASHHPLEAAPRKCQGRIFRRGRSPFTAQLPLFRGGFKHHPIRRSRREEAHLLDAPRRACAGDAQVSGQIFKRRQFGGGLVWRNLGGHWSAESAAKSLGAAGSARCSRRVPLTWVGGELRTALRIRIRPGPGHRSWALSAASACWRGLRGHAGAV